MLKTRGFGGFELNFRCENRLVIIITVLHDYFYNVVEKYIVYTPNPQKFNCN